MFVQFVVEASSAETNQSSRLRLIPVRFPEGLFEQKPLARIDRLPEIPCVRLE
jgi:hypothetical protein